MIDNLELSPKQNNGISAEFSKAMNATKPAHEAALDFFEYLNENTVEECKHKYMAGRGEVYACPDCGFKEMIVR